MTVLQAYRRLDVHVHACHNKSVRTTIEIKAEHHARILELAARRGEKGFSSVVAEALDGYLRAQSSRTKAIHSALALKGSMGEADAEGLLTRTRRIRANWR
jgi:hypothetical protein